MDIVDKKTRSRMMSGIRNRNTKPEILIRHALYAKGFRYRLHDRKLPGKPDIVLNKFKAVIFVHGCFWHGHDCHLFKVPSTRTSFWLDKIEENRVRDKRSLNELSKSGWRACVVWECIVKGKNKRLYLDDLIDELVGWITSDSAWMEFKIQKDQIHGVTKKKK
jgi:DNA mismatch endonuclease (patch repair protein)